MSETAADHVITVYADYVCPFCYLGRAALARYRASADDPPAVEWHPFDLRAGRRDASGAIDPAADDGKDDAYFAQVSENVRRLAERYDVEMAMDVARDVDSRAAQRLALAVHDGRNRETFAALDDALFDALWVAGRDIGDASVLVDVASAAGLDAADVRATLDDEATDAALRSAFDAASRRGVTGVPTFVYDGHAARGAVPPEQLARLVEG